MVNLPRSWLSSSLLFSLLLQPALSLVFEDTEAPDVVKALVDRDVQSSEDAVLSYFDRLSRDSYYWSGMQNGHKTLANLTVDMGDDEASIVSMEKFRHLLKSIDCTKNGMVMEFENARAFGYTQRGWQWVNDEDDRKLILVAGKEHCGWNKYRTPFVVSSIAFDRDSLKAKLTGVASEWKKLFHSYELTIGNVDAPSTDRRDWDPTASMSFNHKIPLSKSFPIPGTDVSVDVSCEGCETKGSFDFGAHIKTDYGVPVAASLTLSPNDVSASFTPRLGLSGNMSKELSDEFKLVTIPVEGISIPGGVLDLGPEIVFSWGYQIGPVNGSAGVSAGVTLSLSDSAKLELDLTDPDVSAGGWKPHVKTKPVEVDAKIEAEAEVYAKAEVQLIAAVLDQGFEAGVYLKPYLGASITASTKKAFDVGAKLGKLGVKAEAGQSQVCVKSKAGVSLDTSIAQADSPEDPIVEKQIAEVTAPMPSKCFNFGPTAGVNVGEDRQKSPASSTKDSSSSHKSTPVSTSSVHHSTTRSSATHTVSHHSTTESSAAHHSTHSSAAESTTLHTRSHHSYYTSSYETTSYSTSTYDYTTTATSSTPCSSSATSTASHHRGHCRHHNRI
ncbi:hypothetical protein MW887_000800 [Aspergillus wentii]|nr:hypothetical protein MW887_000800 [Aspergillus wentii]